MMSSTLEVDERARATARKLVVSVGKFVTDSYDVPVGVALLRCLRD